MTRSAGYHGKIPAQGDFIQRGLPTGFTRAWDRWLMEGIAALKARRGDAWLDGYRTAPLWRFSVPSGAFGDRAMVGVLMASVDRVGRNFPLTIAAEGPAGHSCVSALLAEARMLDRMAEAALGALADGAKKGHLDDAVDAISAEPAEPPLIEETAEALTVEGPNPEAAIAVRWLERRYGPDSAVFLSDAPPGGSRRLIAARGAPDSGFVARLFEGGGAALLIPAVEDDDLLAPIEPDAAAPVVVMAAAPASGGEDDLDALIGGEPFEAGAPPRDFPDLPPELDPDFDAAPPPDPLPGPFSGPPEAPARTIPPSAPKPVTDDELDALIGPDVLGDADPLSADAPPPRAVPSSDEDEDDPIAAILAGGGPES